jgi:hypothetical protein
MADAGAREDEGGESACYAHLACPQCGAILDDPGHSTQCQWQQPDSDSAETLAGTPESST